MNKQNTHQVYLPSVISLSNFLTRRSVRAAWRAQLPRTATYVSRTNKAFERSVSIAPSAWVRKYQRYGCLGTAYDYLVGTIWARKGIRSVFERVEAVTNRSPGLSKAADLAKQLLATETPKILAKQEDRNSLDFYRALGALADLDAMFRAPVPPPRWVYTSRLANIKDLRAEFRTSYPDEFVGELKSLFAVTENDLPRPKRILYNPIFGGRVGTKRSDGPRSLAIGADGDLILGDLLLELKVSVDLFTWDRFWQLLGYVALDRVSGRIRIKKVGIYNPRYRVLWQETVEHLVQYLGGGTVDDFCEWFTENADKIYLSDISGRSRLVDVSK